MATNTDFVRTASWIAKRAASWAGEAASMFNVEGMGPDDNVLRDGVQRFRKEIVEFLDYLESK